jgi:putative nucleotidyltransferase with HDIG domain
MLSYLHLTPYPFIKTYNSLAVRQAVQTIFKSLYPKSSIKANALKNYFEATQALFKGKSPLLKKTNTPYHNFQHTLQVTLCAARIIEGAMRTHAIIISPKNFNKVILASLLHDIGYLQNKNDRNGTGAKHTHHHEMRGALIAGQYLMEQKIPACSIISIQRLILASSTQYPLKHIFFQNTTELFLAKCLCTADLIAQFSDPQYPEKLHFLEKEIQEANAFLTDYPSLKKPEKPNNILKMTQTFWNNTLKKRLIKDCSSVYKFLNRPYHTPYNPYLKAVEKNLTIIQGTIS